MLQINVRAEKVFDVSVGSLFYGTDCIQKNHNKRVLLFYQYECNF